LACERERHREKRNSISVGFCFATAGIFNRQVAILRKKMQGATEVTHSPKPSELSLTLGVHADGEGEECIEDVGGKSRRKETTRKTKTQFGDNIKMYLTGIVCDVMNWTDLAQDRDQWRALVNKAMNLRVP
jgi:hypothetical protein